MKTIIALCLLFCYIHCKLGYIVEKNTRMSIPTEMDRCRLKSYGSYDKFFMTFAACSIYECSENGVVTLEIISAKMHKGLGMWAYVPAVKWVLGRYVSGKIITENQKEHILSYMNGFGDFQYGDVIMGVYDYRSKKVQLYFERTGIKQLKGTYELDNNIFRVYKNLIKENLNGMTDHK